MPGLPPLKKADAQRYASLQHPGDAYAYDIFSKAGQAARSASILGGLKAKHVLAAGESQSAGFLTTYVNTVGRSGKIFDGYLIPSDRKSAVSEKSVSVRVDLGGRRIMKKKKI